METGRSTRSTRPVGRLSTTVLAATLVVVGACGGGGEATSPEEPLVDMSDDTGATGQAADNADSADTELLFSWWGGDSRNEYTNAVADLFQEANPSVAISRSPTDWDGYWQRLAVESAGGTPPDLIQMHPNHLSQYAGNEVLQPLGPLLESGDLNVGDISDSVLNAGSVGGELYMVPIGNPYMSIMYDADLLAEAGLEAPELGYTWDDLFALLEEWAAAGPEGAPWPAEAMAESDQHFYSWLLSRGTQPYDEAGALGFTEGDLAEWYGRWLEMLKAGAIPPQDVFEEESTATIEDSMIVRGRVGMHGVPSNQLATFDDLTDHTIEILPMPAGPEGPGHVLLPAGLSISSQLEDPTAAAEFISFFVTDPEAGAAYRADNGVPGDSGQRDFMVESGDLPESQVKVFDLFDQISGEIPPMNPLPPDAGLVIDALTRYWSEVGFEQQTPDEAAAAFFAEVVPQIESE